MNSRRLEILSIAALLLLSSLAFAHLMILPAFEDEGSQLRWIWRLIEAGEWLQPLSDGKPLEVWPIVPLVRLGLPDLAAARAMHVLSGMLAVLLTYRLALVLGDRAAAIVSAALLAVCPFLVYLQRLALSDVFMCTAGIWVLLSVIRFIGSTQKASAIELACSLTLAAFCKFPVGFVFLTAMPLALLWMPSEARRRLLCPPALMKLLAAHVPIALLIAAVALVAVVRLGKGLSPGFGLQDFLGIGLGRYSDIAKSIGIAPPHLLSELAVQLSWPVTVMGCVGIGAAAIIGDWRCRWLAATGLMPLVAIGVACLILVPALFAVHASASHHCGRVRLAPPVAGCREYWAARRVGRIRALRSAHGPPVGADHPQSRRGEVVAARPLPIFRRLDIGLWLPGGGAIAFADAERPGDGVFAGWSQCVSIADVLARGLAQARQARHLWPRWQRTAQRGRALGKSIQPHPCVDHSPGELVVRISGIQLRAGEFPANRSAPGCHVR